MKDYQLRIIKRAAIAKIKDGENIDVILNSYSKLTNKERTAMRAEIVEELDIKE